MACTVLGAALPWVLCTFVLPEGLRGARVVDILRGAEDGPRAAAAVAATAGIVALSVPLHGWSDQGLATAVLWVAALGEWACLDGSVSTLLGGAMAGVLGPIAEIPLIGIGCWHYLQPDYFPLLAVVEHGGAGGSGMEGEAVRSSWSEIGIEGVTGPCYFAVCADSMAVYRYLSVFRVHDAAETRRREGGG